MTLPTDPSLRIASCAKQHTGDGRHLGLAEGGVDLRAGERLGHVAQQGVRRRRGTPGQGPQLQFRGFGPLRGAHHLPLGGHQEHRGDLLGLKDVEQRARIECAQRVEHRRQAEQQAG